MSRNRSILATLGGAAVGILIGSFTARTDTRALEEELETTKKALAKAQEDARSPGAALAAGLRTMLNAPSAARRAPATADVSTPDADSTASPAPDAGAVPTPLVRFVKSAPNSPERKEAIDTLAATWRARAAQAKAGFFEQAELKDEQLPAFQGVIDHMNSSVKALVDEALESGALHSPPEQREVVSLLVELGEVYLDVDTRLRDVLTPEQQAKVTESRFELFSQVDPDVVMPLMLQLDSPPRGDSAP